MPLNPHKKQLIFCLLACLAVRATYAQHKAPSHLHSIKPTTDFDQRFYYLPGETQNVWGYRVGVLINDRYKLGIGGYYMNKTVDLGVPSTPLTRTNLNPQTLHKKLYLGTIYYEPYLMRRKLWESSLVFETGYGRTVNYMVDKTNDKIAENNNALLVPAGIGLSVNLKLPPLFHLQCFRWIGINAMSGYRTSIYLQDKQYNYNGTY